MLDRSVLNDLKRGNREAFNRVFRYYYPKMMAYAASMVGKRVAEDITQDVFLYVWENREKVYVGEGFHSYLFQSTYTRCLDHFKKNLSEEKYHSAVYDKHMEEYQNLLKGDSPIMKELFSKDFYSHLYALLDLLPEKRREVFILTYINGLKAKEVADKTGMPQRTVESHLYLSLRFLKERMSGKDYCLLLVLYLWSRIHA